MTIPTECYRITLRWRPKATEWPGELALNTLGVRRTPVGGVFGLSQGIADHVAARLAANWAGIQGIHGVGYGITEIKCVELDTTNHVVDEGVHEVTDGSLDGSAGGGIMPPEVAVAVGLYGYVPGGFATRRGTKRGRIYLPYIAKSLAGSDGKLSADGVTAVMDGYGAVLGDLATFTVGSDTLTLGIISPTASTFTPLTHYACDNHFDAQRRRQHQAPAVVTSRVLPASGEV
jgi:hypothetical protein